MPDNQPVLGIIGGGQLGSMLCMSAKKINIDTVILSDDEEAPAQNFCNKFIHCEYSNFDKIKEFLSIVDVVTFEFENIPIKVLNYISKEKTVLPEPGINQIIQNRKTEKEFINKLDIKTTPWCYVKSKEDIQKNKNLLPGILKTCTLGYDGKGQYVLNNLQDVKNDWFLSQEYILEKLVNLQKEISVIITRFRSGEVSIFEPIENIHKNQILRNSIIPSNISSKIKKQALDNAKTIAEKLNYIGTMCVEYFVDNKENLIVNEIAPRVHNSGHLTINAFEVSQFENHIRAVCNLSIKKNNKICDAEMINIIGPEIKKYRKKSFKKNEFFYDYLKKEIKESRKMGHLTITSD